MRFKANRRIMVLGIGFAIALSGCILLAFLWIDRTISLTYSDQGLHSTLMTNDLLVRLLENEWIGISKDQVLSKLEALNDRHPNGGISIFQKQDSGSVFADTLEFKIEDGKFKSIKR